VTTFDVIRRETPQAGVVADPATIVACRYAINACIDAQPPGHRSYDYIVTAGDAWGSSSFMIAASIAVPNNPPVVKLRATKGASGGQVVAASASDRDNDSVTLTWRVDGRQISNSRQRLLVRRTGSHTVVVFADDGYGGATTATIRISVR
jgi:hypothetical protein